jgi:hypothetical protein
MIRQNHLILNKGKPEGDVLASFGSRMFVFDEVVLLLLHKSKRRGICR